MCRFRHSSRRLPFKRSLRPFCQGLAGPGLIAHIATCKYADHLPLYRIEGIFARYGIEISRSTMCDWMGEVARLAWPLVKLMRERMLKGRVIHTDDTTVPVQDVGKTKTGRLWCYIGDLNAPYILYDYTPDRKKEHPPAMNPRGTQEWGLDKFLLSEQLSQVEKKEAVKGGCLYIDLQTSFRTATR